MSPRLEFVLVLLAGSIAVPLSPRAATDDRKSLVVQGRVVDRDGWPIERARISARGSRSASTSSDAAGRFTLELPLPAPAALGRDAVEFTLEARAGSARLALSDGARELRFALRMIGAPGEAARAEIRASQAAAAAALARAYARAGSAADTLVLAFAPATNGADAVLPAGLSAREEVPLAGVSVPGSKPESSARTAPDTGDAAALERGQGDRREAEEAASGREAIQPPPGDRPAREEPAGQPPAGGKSSSGAASRGKSAPPAPTAAGQRAPAKASPGKRPGASEPRPGGGREKEAGVSPPPQSGPPPARKPSPRTPSGGSDGQGRTASPPAPARMSPEPCGCRIEGTIEVRSDRPLSHRLPLIVRLRDQTACRDTVELFMGSPRVFELVGAGCGKHVIEVDIPERERFRLANPESERAVTCARGSLRQVRLILLPR